MNMYKKTWAGIVFPLLLPFATEHAISKTIHMESGKQGLHSNECEFGLKLAWHKTIKQPLRESAHETMAFVLLIAMNSGETPLFAWRSDGRDIIFSFLDECAKGETHVGNIVSKHLIPYVRNFPEHFIQAKYNDEP